MLNDFSFILILTFLSCKGSQFVQKLNVTEFFFLSALVIRFIRIEDSSANGEFSCFF